MPTLVTPPSEEVVSLEEARLHLYQPHTSQDTVITALITAARRKCEQYLSTTFITSTWDYVFDGFPYASGGGCHGRTSQANQIQIPNPPLISVTSINYLDGDSGSFLLDPSGYTITTGLYGKINPAYGTSWPTYQNQPGAVTIRYVAGYGDAASVPATIKAAILLYVGYLFVNRGDEDMPIPRAIADLLDSESRGFYA